MNLHMLAATADAHRETDQAERQLQAEAAIGQATALLGLAEREDWQNRERVLSACHLLMDAIQLQRGLITPYLYLTHVMIVFRDERQALHYLQQACAIDATDPDVVAYQAFLSQPGVTDSDADRAPDPEPSETGPAVEPPLTRAGLEQQIYRQLQRVLSQAEPAPAPETCEPLRRRCRRLEAVYGQLEQARQRLAPDDFGLQQRLRPLETLLARCRRSLAQAEELQALQRDIDALAAAVAGWSDGSLNRLYDACDQLANRLDALDGQVEMAGLTARYERMIAAAGQLQQALAPAS